jgi:hypothetical protein
LEYNFTPAVKVKEIIDITVYIGDKEITLDYGNNNLVRLGKMDGNKYLIKVKISGELVQESEYFITLKRSENDEFGDVISYIVIGFGLVSIVGLAASLKRKNSKGGP